MSNSKMCNSKLSDSKLKSKVKKLINTCPGNLVKLFPSNYISNNQVVESSRSVKVDTSIYKLVENKFEKLFDISDSEASLGYGENQLNAPGADFIITFARDYDAISFKLLFFSDYVKPDCILNSKGQIVEPLFENSKYIYDLEDTDDDGTPAEEKDPDALCSYRFLVFRDIKAGDQFIIKNHLFDPLEDDLEKVRSLPVLIDQNALDETFCVKHAKEWKEFYQAFDTSEGCIMKFNINNNNSENSELLEKLISLHSIYCSACICNNNIGKLNTL